MRQSPPFLTTEEALEFLLAVALLAPSSREKGSKLGRDGQLRFITSSITTSLPISIRKEGGLCFRVKVFGSLV